MLGRKIIVTKALTDRGEWNFAFNQVSQDGLALEHLEAKYQDDEDIVLAAIQKDVEAVPYSSERLQARLDFWKKAVQIDPAAAKFAPKEVQENEEIVAIIEANTP
ncbi:MAG: DUF4116 domain-containing protein [Candidatus Margulisiibacteriota bacterium]|jgi:hypothetical protein